MTDTTRRTFVRRIAERLPRGDLSFPVGSTHWSRQATIAALPGLLMPKCVACLHVFAWLTSGALGTQVELCGDPAQPWRTAILELVIILAFLLAIRWARPWLGGGQTPCSAGCRF